MSASEIDREEPQNCSTEDVVKHVGQFVFIFKSAA